MFTHDSISDIVSYHFPLVLLSQHTVRFFSPLLWYIRKLTNNSSISTISTTTTTATTTPVMTPAETGAIHQERDYYVKLRHACFCHSHFFSPVSSVEGRVEAVEDVTSNMELLEEVADVTIGKTVERGSREYIADCTSIFLHSTISLT